MTFSNKEAAYGANTESDEEVFFPVALTSSPVFTRNWLACGIFYAFVDKICRKRDFFLAFPLLVAVTDIFRFYHCYDPEI